MTQHTVIRAALTLGGSLFYFPHSATDPTGTLCHVSVRPNSGIPIYPRNFNESPSAVIVPLYVCPEFGSYNLPSFAWSLSARLNPDPSSSPHNGRPRIPSVGL